MSAYDPNHRIAYAAPERQSTETRADAGDRRLIEAGFPCHQVGAETQRERGASSALPPLYYLHVWWARRPLTPSRAAILASLLPADADPERFIRRLGIECLVADVTGTDWIIDDDSIRGRIEDDGQGGLELPVDGLVLRRFDKEQERRAEHRALIEQLIENTIELREEPTLTQWYRECEELPAIGEGNVLPVSRRMGNPAWAKERIELENRYKIRTNEDKYKYPRAYHQPIQPTRQPSTILDPTAGGGSIPLEAIRLGHQVIANELNPIASVILTATIDYPVRFGKALLDDIDAWGSELRDRVVGAIEPFFPTSAVPEQLASVEGVSDSRERAVFKSELLDGFLYCRQATCPHCSGEAPLLNSQWLSKEGEKWGVAVEPQADRTVAFRPYAIERGSRGPNGEDPNGRTVTRGIGQCVHCQQAIDGDEIKRQARGESEHGRWRDRLYCVVAIRMEPKRDKQGRIQRYASGPRVGEIKTRKLRYFRAPNTADHEALAAAEAELERRRFDFELEGVIPTEEIGKISNYDRGHRMYGEYAWSDMFTPRQLLGHAIATSELKRLKNSLFEHYTPSRAAAIVTYLQFALDKCLDYNCRHTRWEYTRGVIKGAFSRHNFAVQWTFGEMVYAGPSSGLAWGLSQVTDAYEGIAQLVEPVARLGDARPPVTITSESATHLSSVADASVDAIVMDPPYYDNVQYSELSDFYYVWQKRTLGDLYPEWFTDTVTDKSEEAVANPARDGSARAAKAQYETLMRGIFAEGRRVLRPDGIMTLMFTHKSQDAWETLTNALIESGWDITSAMPVESESGHSTHQMNMAAAASSIFIACRPAERASRQPASWSFGGGVKAELETAVRRGLQEFEALRLNPVDRMVAAWGRALRVYSAHWPVIDGDERVSPTRAMQEAARVVAEEEVNRLSEGRVTVDELDAETRVAVIALGINGLGEFAFDDGLQMSKSLNLALALRNGNYRVDGQTVAYANAGDHQAAAVFAKKGSRLRLLRPEERLPARLEHPQTLWDALGGLITNYRAGGVVAARNYLATHGHRDSDTLRGLLQVWARECRHDTLRREALLIEYEL